MTFKTPKAPENSFRVRLELEQSEPRLDLILMDALQKQDDNQELKNISKTQYKKLFTDKKVLIKGQSARAKSTISSGVTFIDILIEEKSN